MAETVCGLRVLGACLAPCAMHTPPRLANLEQPSVVQVFRVTMAPCATHTPPVRAYVRQSSALHKRRLFFIFGASLACTCGRPGLSRAAWRLRACSHLNIATRMS